MTRISILALIVAMSVSSAAIAQCPPPPSASSLAVGEIGLFFDPFGTQTCGNAGSPVTLYVVARVPEGGVAEFRIPRLLQLSGPSIQVISSALPQGSAYQAGISFDTCTIAYRPNLQTCPTAQGDLLVISQVTMFAPGAQGTACFETACPWIGGGLIAVPPSYRRCDSGVFGSFVGGESMCIGFGEAPVATENFTWGAVKAMYR